MMKILYVDLVGLNWAFSIIFWRTLSTPVWLAASISITSIERDALISSHELQALHGSKLPSLRFGQFKDLAKIRAVVVLPTPRGPEKRYACAVLFFFT